MKKLFTIALLVGFMLALGACASRRQADEKSLTQEQSAHLEILGFTQRDLYPGIPSNLIKTRAYRVIMNGEFTGAWQVEGLRVDSVLLKTYDLTVAGKNSRGAQIYLEHSEEKIDVSFSRYILQSYDDDQQAMMYMQWLDDPLPQGVFELVLRAEDGAYIIKRLEAPEVLAPVHAP